MFDENKHPRDSGGKFTEKSASELKEELVQELPPRTAISEKKIESDKKVVEIDLNSEVQKRLDEAKTPKERQQIAFRYIMDNLRGKYTAPDGRTVAIERVGADKMTYQDIKIKLRVCPSLADMLKVGEFQYITKSEEKKNQKFKEFAYYKVTLKVGDERYNGLLNIGIRGDGSSTLYDLKPLYKQ